jgi:DNA-directed RNA polymerase subunit RPC12/RpoP
MDKTTGLTCPECSGVVPLKEGDRIVTCPFCGVHALVKGEHGIRRWQVLRRVEREGALRDVKDFFSGIKKARDLKKEAQINDMFLVYLPYWRVQADVAGWRFGRKKVNKDSTKPIEAEVLEQMHWNDAALDVSEYGVHRVMLSKDLLEPYDSEALHAEALVFEPTESHTDAREEAHGNLVFRGRAREHLTKTFFEKFHFLNEQLSIVYYPLWVARYAYRKRHYQVVVDGVNGNVLYGKAPGNIFYRAGALVAGLAAGNFILVNGTLAMGAAFAESSDSDGGWIILAPIVIGIALIIFGYRAFRYGEEVEQIEGKVKKAATGKGIGIGSGQDLMKSLISGNTEDLEGLMQTGMSFIDEMQEMQKR